LKKQPEIEIKEGELMEDSSVAKLFEEVKIMFQDLPARLERNNEPSYRKRKYRFHPEMLDELMYMADNSEDNYFGFFVLISLYKEDMPWVFEIGKETYEILNSTKPASTKEKAISNFRRMIKYTLHHPIFTDFLGSKEQMMMLNKTMYSLEKYLRRITDTNKE
jgi:hypothetical protein